jgi:urease accessory protein
MISKLHIAVGCRQGVSYLEQSFFTPPFKIANITEQKRSPDLKLMLMSSSPGVLDGDDYSLLVDIAENAQLELNTQSYQRLFDMKVGATQRQQINMGRNSAFTFLPHPSVPHQNSSFTNKSKIFMSDNCTLIWGEVLTCGRKLNGEVFLFSKYHSVTEVFLENKIVVRENLLLLPSLADPMTMGQMEGYTHQASLLYIGPQALENGFLDAVHEYISRQDDIMSGVSVLPANGIVVRLLGTGAETLHRHLKAIASSAIENQKNILQKADHAG